MKYYIYVEDNILKGAGCARCLNKEIQNIEVTETLCTDYISDNDKYIYSEEKIIPNLLCLLMRIMRYGMTVKQLLKCFVMN